jgi:hypothetical protein
MHDTNGKLKCDMRAECAAPIARLDDKGYVYCEPHGAERKLYRPCRKLRAWELRKLERGETLSRY